MKEENVRKRRRLVSMTLMLFVCTAALLMPLANATTASVPPSSDDLCLEDFKIKEISPTVYAFKSLDGDVIEIGSERHSPPQQYLKISRWDGEVSLKVDVPYVNQEVPEFIDNRLKWSNDKYKVEFYPKEPEEITAVIAGKEFTFMINENGGVEFDLILKEKPDSNVFSFPILSKGLKFYYQPALHPEHPTWADTDGDGKADSFRPENMVGSYAVYHATQDKLWKTEAEAEKYQTGKAFHIYRPKVYDAEENEIWGELKIDEEKGVLTVTVDQDWLDNAVYPVTIDPIFGYDATLFGMPKQPESNRITGSCFEAPETGTANSISFLTQTSGEVTYKCAIYRKDGALIGHTEEKKLNSVSKGWYTFDIVSGGNLVGGTEYYLVFWPSYDPITSELFHWCVTETEKGAYQDQTYGTWPAWSPTITNWKWAIYCTYTPLAVVLNEVCYSPSEGDDWFELYNPHDSPVNIDGWRFENDNGDTIYTTDHTIDPGCWDVVYVGDQLTDTDSILAYNSENTLVDFVAWGGDSSRDTEAAAAGIWDEGDYVDNSKIGGTYNSIYLLQDGVDNDQSSDWGARDDPTPRAPVPDVSALVLFASGLILVVVYLAYGRRKKGELN